MVVTVVGKGGIALIGVSVVTAVAIGYIHYGQRVERENLHKGVIRDKELYRIKARELGHASPHD